MSPSSQLLEGPPRPSAGAADASWARRRRLAAAGPGSDQRLANRAGKGDRRAIAAIFERYQHGLYGFCMGILGDHEDAQDALQNTMVKVLKALPGEEREIALRPWLYRIAHNEAVELRRSKRPIQALDAHLADGRSSVAEKAEQREQLGWLLKDLADLPDRQRAVLVMRELNGLAFAEIGAALDTSAAVVRQSLYEARRNLEQIGSGRCLRCDAVIRVLSDADRRITRRRDIRAHLRDCPDCRRVQHRIESREGILAAIPPLPAAAAAGLAQAAAGSSGGGIGAALTAGVGKTVGACGALKAAGTVAAVALIGASAIRYEPRAEPLDRGSPVTPLDVRGSSSPPGRKAQSGRSARPPRGRSFVGRRGRPAGAPDRRVANRHPASPVPEHALSSRISTRPAAVPPQTRLAEDPPAMEAAPGLGAESPEPENQPGHGQKAAKNEVPASQPGEPPGQAPKPEGKAAPEPPAKAEKGPAKAEKHAEQTSKPAKPEKPPPVALPPPPGSEPAAADAEEPPPAAEDASSNGRARGHEKQLADQD